MTTKPLSAEDAGELYIRKDDPINAKIYAIRDGHHVVVPRITEAQAREAFEAWMQTVPSEYWPPTANNVWLAAHRHAGLLIASQDATIEDKP